MEINAQLSSIHKLISNYKLTNVLDEKLVMQRGRF